MRGQLLCECCPGERLILGRIPAYSIAEGVVTEPEAVITQSTQLRHVIGGPDKNGQYKLSCGHTSRIIRLSGLISAQEWLADQPDERGHLYLNEVDGTL